MAFIIMVSLACINISKEKQPPHPPFSRISGLPNLFGVCVYSFMCHHSLPSLITPISIKKRLSSLILGDYLLILSFYFLLAFTGIFAFREINDLYTLNFQVGYFIVLFYYDWLLDHFCILFYPSSFKMNLVFFHTYLFHCEIDVN